MPRTPDISHYRAKGKRNLNPLQNYISPIQKGMEGEGFAVDDGEPTTQGGSPAEQGGSPITLTGDRNIVNYSKSPVNTDLEYYNKITNLKNNNNMLVEKYGLQGVRDQAVSSLAQQDVIRQQSDRALAEQLRATGLNSGAMSETMRGNLLMNYAGNVKNIQNQYQSDINSAVDQQRLDKYNELKSNIIDDLNAYNSQEVLSAINNSDLSREQKNDLLQQYNIKIANINGQNQSSSSQGYSSGTGTGLDNYFSDLLGEDYATSNLPLGVTTNEDGTYNYGNITIPSELGAFLSRDGLDVLINSLRNSVVNGDNYNDAKDNFVASFLSKLKDSDGNEYLKDFEKEYYTKYLKQLFDNAYGDAREDMDKFSEKLKNSSQNNETGAEITEKPENNETDVEASGTDVEITEEPERAVGGGYGTTKWDGHTYNGNQLYVETGSLSFGNAPTKAYFKEDGKWYSIKVTEPESNEKETPVEATNTTDYLSDAESKARANASAERKRLEAENKQQQIKEKAQNGINKTKEAVSSTANKLKEYYSTKKQEFNDENQRLAQEREERETKAKKKNAEVKESVKNTLNKASNNLKELYGKVDQEKINQTNEKITALVNAYSNGSAVAWSKQNDGKVIVGGKEYNFGAPTTLSENKIPSGAKEIGKNTYIQGNYIYRKIVENNKIVSVKRYSIID